MVLLSEQPLVFGSRDIPECVDSGLRGSLSADGRNVCLFRMGGILCRYTLRTALYVGDAPEPADIKDITIGFCRKHFDPERGFFLNGRQVKVHGTCEHHDLGCLGATFHKEAMHRRLPGKQRVRIRASGDGSFFLRCMSKSGTDRVRLIFQLEFCAKGFGPAYLDPYSFVSAGLYTDSTGEIGNGNEKGITSARDGVSAAVYSGPDFGDYGSDTITMPIFAVDDESHVIESWFGKPGSRLDLKGFQFHRDSGSENM